METALHELRELKTQLATTVAEREGAKEFGRIMENAQSALKLENDMLARVANEGTVYVQYSSRHVITDHLYGRF